MELKELRKSKKITQKELAQKLGVSISVISRYEAGNIIPTPERLEEIAEALDVVSEDIDIIPLVKILPENKIEPTFLPTPTFIKKAIIMRSRGFCELCGKEAPFQYKGHPHLKIYRLKNNPQLKDNLSNYAALCPNCYDKVCLLKNQSDIDIIKKNVEINMEQE